MSLNLSNYLAGALLDHLTDRTAWTAPVAGSLYIALLSDAAAASDDTTTNAAKEVINQVTLPGTGGYARQSVSFDDHASRISLNTNVVTFGPAATANWDEVTDAWIVDAATGGNILWQGTLDKSKTVEILDTLVIPVGSVSLTLA